MLLPPDNFLYCITLFATAIFAATYLIFTYYINRLLVLNALLFVIVAARVASEYYLQTLTSFEEVQAFLPYHSSFAIPPGPVTWVLAWLYVRPAKGWRYENGLNVLFFLLLIPPYLLHTYYLVIDPQIYLYPTERVGDYWAFYANTDFWYYPYFILHTRPLVFLTPIILLIGVYRLKRKRLRQLFLVASYIFLPIGYFALTRPDAYNVPATGLLYLLHALVISWFLSNYRLFSSNINLITADLLNSVSELTISTDPELKITNWNQQTQEVFTVEKPDIEQFLDNHLAPNSSTDDSTEPLSARSIVGRLTREEMPAYELTMMDRHRNNRIINLRVAPFSNGSQLLGYTFLLTDLSDIRANERKLTELNRTKDRLFAIIGHDLRKSALPFKNFAKNLNYLIQQRDFDRIDRYGSSLETAALSLNNLLDNLLSWALQQRKVVPYNPEVLLLTPVVLDCFDTLQPLADSKSVALRMDVSADLTLYADRHAVSTILRNLLDNAIKFSRADQVVRLTCSRDAARVDLTVTDRGIGMSEEQQRQLFTDGASTSRRGTAGESGTGLGMDLVVELTRINQGTINIFSTPGEGTRIVVNLPATELPLQE